MLKLLSLNIEGDNHYDKIFAFFEQEQPDVICLQEFFLEDLSLFESRLRMHALTSTLWDRRKANPYRQSLKGRQGIAMFSKLPFIQSEELYYVGEKRTIPDAMDVGPDGVNRSLLVGHIQKDEQNFTIATTHFTWSDNGQPSDIQRRDIQSLFAQTNSYRELVLCGDFNAPRGTEIFALLAQRFTDNIPADITTTMDNALHRIPTLKPLVVDGLFTTPQYSAKDVRIIGGVSDHKAIVATLSK